MRECLSKTFTASPELAGTALQLDVWLPLGLTNLDSVTVKLVSQEPVAPSAVVWGDEELQTAWGDPEGNAWGELIP